MYPLAVVLGNKKGSGSLSLRWKAHLDKAGRQDESNRGFKANPDRRTENLVDVISGCNNQYTQH